MAGKANPWAVATGLASVTCWNGGWWHRGCRLLKLRKHARAAHVLVFRASFWAQMLSELTNSLGVHSRKQTDLDLVLANGAGHFLFRVLHNFVQVTRRKTCRCGCTVLLQLC